MQFQLIENILFHSSINELNKHEIDQIDKHINSCEKCQSSHRLLNYFQQTMKAELTENKKYFVFFEKLR